MSRKVPSFDQLIAYMDLGASSRDNNIYHNLFSRKPEGIETEFRDNFRYVPKRKNGVTLYHEVISITRSQQVDEREQIKVLRQIIYKYIQDRAGNNLVYGVLHDDKADNLHYHLLISSNAVESEKKHRLSKTQFDSVKKNLELYVLDCHPELQQKKLISKDKQATENTDSLSNKGAELKRRTGKTPQRDIVKESLLTIFASASTREEFIELMELEHFQLYKRGKHWGILNESTNRKHRFVTLGISEEFQKLEARLAKQFDDHVTKTEKQDNQESEKPADTTQQSESVDDTVKETNEQVAEARKSSEDKRQEGHSKKDKEEQQKKAKPQEKQASQKQPNENKEQEKQSKPQSENQEKPAQPNEVNEENSIEEEIAKRQADAQNFRNKKAKDKSRLKKKR